MDVDEEGKHPKKDVTTTAVDESKNHAVEDSLTPLSRQDQTNGKQKARKRKVSFPEGECLVSKSVEPVDPWANATNALSADVIKAYMNSCARLRVKPIDKLIKQLKDHDIFQSRIDVLDLKGIKLDIRSCEALEEVFKRVQVYTLDIENTNLEDEGAIALVEMIEFYHSAVQINIGYNPRIKVRGWQTFSQMVRKAPFVEFVDIRHCCFTDPSVALMARSLKFNVTLRVLHLEGDNLSGKLLIILCTGLKLNQHLTELFLGDNFLVPSDANTLSGMLKLNSTLQLLDIRNNMLQDQGLLHLCEGLHQQGAKAGIKTLVLWNNQITCNGMVPLSGLLAVNRTIQTLNIGHNRLGNEGIRNLHHGLLKNKSLLRLGLLNTKISAEGAVALAEYIADTRSLLRLDLRENDVFVGGLMALTLAVKINETVVRIDLDKDLKKEQGMEGTQTSLLVDIYQYLERNKKLGISREELKRKQKELEVQKLVVKKQGDETEVEEKHCENTTDAIDNCNQSSVDEPVVEAPANCNEKETTDAGQSRFTVSKVEDLRHKTADKSSSNEMDIIDNNLEEKGIVYQEIKDGRENHLVDGLGSSTNDEIQDEATKFMENSSKDGADMSSNPDEFEKELDELLANVSGVNIDLTDLPTQDDEDFWNKDMQQILGSSSS